MNGKKVKWDKKAIIEVINRIIVQTGQFPTTSWLQQNGYGSIVGAIYARYGNIERIAKYLGLNAQEHSKGFWLDWKNIKKEIQKIMLTTKTFPNYKQIRLLNSKILKGIKIFGGIGEVAKKMGYAPPSQIVALDGHNVRSSYEFFVDNLLYKHGIKHSIDGYIDKKTSNFRYDFKINNYFVEIWGYPDTDFLINKRYIKTKAQKELFYKFCGFSLVAFNVEDFLGSPKQIEYTILMRLKDFGIHSTIQKINNRIQNYYHYSGYWTKEKTIEEIKKVIQVCKTFPIRKELRKMKKSSLEFAMDKYGGVNYFRQLLGYEVKKHNQSFWSEKRIIEQLKDIVAKFGYFPSHQDLIKGGYTKLAAQVEHKGGFKKFQKLFGYPSKHKSDGFYQNRANIRAECKRIYLQLGHFPSANDLLVLKENTLRKAISAMGGYKYYRNLIEITK